MQPDQQRLLLRVLLQKDDDWWVARGLEKDIAAQAANIADVVYEFERALIGHIVFDVQAGRQPLATVPSAPQEVFEMWDYAATRSLTAGNAVSRTDSVVVHVTDADDPSDGKTFKVDLTMNSYALNKDDE